jgi:hypothetical protein
MRASALPFLKKDLSVTDEKSVAKTMSSVLEIEKTIEEQPSKDMQNLFFWVEENKG